MMRNLTIKRTKSFVGCLAKMKVYIEDPIAGELTIDNVPCRKLGDLKNGEEKSFLIDEQAARIFVIADKLSRNYCNEYYQIPFGGEDIYLSGRNKYNPANGNAFRFDNNDSAEVAAHRKKGNRKGIVVLCVAAVIGVIVGVLIGMLGSGGSDDPKKFTKSGMHVTLTEEFVERSVNGYTVAYDSAEVAVFVIKESISLAECFEDYTLAEYGELVLQANGLQRGTLQKKDGLTYFEYEATNPQTDEVHCYCSFIYKAADAFWLVQFATTKENYE